MKSARLQGYGCSLPLWLAVVLGTIMLIRSQIATAATAVAAMVLSVSGYAGTPPGNLPEPGTWALLGLAAAIGIAVTRKKRK